MVADAAARKEHQDIDVKTVPPVPVPSQEERFIARLWARAEFVGFSDIGNCERRERPNEDEEPEACP